jgi:hypothetical protein
MTIKEDPIEDIVTKIYWSKIGTNSKGVIGQYSGISEFVDLDLTQEFIPFHELTKQVVLDWVLSSIDTFYMQRIDQAIDFDIFSKTHESTETKPSWLDETVKA